MDRKALSTALALLLVPAGAALAAVDGAHVALSGNDRGAPPCTACHGAEGAGLAAAGYPRLAGLNAGYIARQLADFASGTRQNAIMQPIASALSDAERAAVGDYFSHLPVSVPAPAATAPDARGEQLALTGDWSRQLPGCVQCHGPHGVGVGANFPPLAAQPAAYLVAQLKDWQTGTRKNDPLGLMQHVAAVLDDADIDAVAAWFAAQPATLANAGEQP